MSMLMTLAAFAIGSTRTPEGWTAAKLVEDGIGVITNLPKARTIASAARRVVYSYPILTYVAMATIIIISSQPATHARMANAVRSAIDGAYTLGKWLALMAQMRRNIPHGVATCSILLAVMALISYGDAAVEDRFASVSDERVAQQVYSTAMQSLPAGAIPINAKSMWLGDTGAGMHCVTDIRMA
eukprot:3528299-Pleurochrysis_carterae.AAC.1